MVLDGRALRLDDPDKWIVTSIDSKPPLIKIFFSECLSLLAYAVCKSCSHSSSISAHKQSSRPVCSMGRLNAQCDLDSVKVALSGHVASLIFGSSEVFRSRACAASHSLGLEEA